MDITVTSSMDRPSQRDQIAVALARALERNETLRIRLPLSLYDYSENRGYTFVRDAAWNLQLPAVNTTPEMVMRLIETVGKCIVAIAEQGSDEVERKLGATA